MYRDRLLMTTLDGHLVALDTKSGKVLWDVEIGDHKLGHASTVAPLIVKDKVIVGIAGGEFAIRGFLDAYDPMDGKRLWRFWTVPAAGRARQRNLAGRSVGARRRPDLAHRTYDPELNLIYWGTGNPNPDFYGADRKGDNLYTELADRHRRRQGHDPTGTTSSHRTMSTTGTPTRSRCSRTSRSAASARKVVMLANRNGFFYVLDRANGKFIHARPYVEQTWAKEIGADGRPVEIPEQRPTAAGTRTCPDLFGGTNFMSPSFNPATGLFYVTARETCMVYLSAAPPATTKMGDRTMGGSMRPVAGGTGALRAIDPVTGARKWEIAHPTPSWAGVLSTAGGVVFSGTNEGHIFAADATTRQGTVAVPAGRRDLCAADDIHGGRPAVQW